LFHGALKNCLTARQPEWPIQPEDDQQSSGEIALALYPE
jgi:hypothetical protein